jgi:hypothetical protein
MATVRKKTKKTLRKKSSRKLKTLRITLRDPNNIDERHLQEEILAVSNRLWWAWFLGAPQSDIKTLAKRANLYVKTVENFVHGITKRPSLGTFVRLAWAAGYRVTLVLLNSKRQRDEVEAMSEADRLLRKHLSSLPAPKKRR